MPETVSVVMMVRDAAPILERALQSVFDREVPLAEECVLVPGGPSLDGTEDLISRLSGKWPLRYVPLPDDLSAKALEDGELVDYSIVRNWGHAQAKGAWHLWLDADDVVPSPERVRKVFPQERHEEIPDGTPLMGLGEFLTTLPPRKNSLWCSYHYHIEPTTDRVLTAYPRERILRWQDGFMWVWPIHEQISPVPPNRFSAETRYDHPYFWIEHRPVKTEAERLVRNYRILERLKPLAEIRWRVAYYLADYYTWTNEFKEAAVYFDKAAALSGNDEERYLTWHNAHRLAVRAGWHDHAVTSALRAHAYKPHGIEALADLVCISAITGNAAQCLHWYGLYKDAEQGQESLFAAESKLLPHLAAAPMLGASRRYEEAVEACRAALRFEPRHPDAKRMLALGMRMAARIDAAKSALAVIRHAREIGDREAALAIAAALPPPVREMPDLVAEQRDMEKEDGEDEILKLELVPAPPPWCPPDVPYFVGSGAGPLLASLPSVVALDDVWNRLEEAEDLAHTGASKIMLLIPYEDTGPPDAIRTESPLSWHRKLSMLGDVEFMDKVHPGGEAQPRLRAWLRLGQPRNGKTVHLYCPAFIEPWGPTSPEAQGSGASEEQAVLLARWLSGMGCRVTVWGAVQDTLVDQSVLWRPVSQWTVAEECDLLIAHRAPWIGSHSVRAKQTYVWLHDTPESFPAAAFMPRVRRNIGRYVTLTRTMQTAYQTVHQAGQDEPLGYFLPPCDLEELPASLAEGHDVCYLSAPYRGLLLLLQAWPAVREAVPDATLKIAYGWQVHDAMARAEGTGGLAAMRKVIEKEIAQPGVTWLDRLPQAGVRDVLDASRVWAYPCTYPEMLCSTAQRAMARACWPVIFPTAALAEVVSGGVHVPDLEGFKTALIRELQRPAEELRELRLALRDVALRRHRDAIEAWERALRQDGIL